jgi:hypothetical protein
VAENKNHVVFEVNVKKMRMRACVEKSLESATKYGKVDAGRTARRTLLDRVLPFTLKLNRLLARLFVCHKSRMPPLFAPFVCPLCLPWLTGAEKLRF